MKFRPIYFYFLGIIVGVIETVYKLSLWRCIAFNFLVLILVELLVVAFRKKEIPNDIHD